MNRVNHTHRGVHQNFNVSRETSEAYMLMTESGEENIHLAVLKFVPRGTDLPVHMAGFTVVAAGVSRGT